MKKDWVFPFDWVNPVFRYYSACEQTFQIDFALSKILGDMEISKAAWMYRQTYWKNCLEDEGNVLVKSISEMHNLSNAK